MGQGNPNEPGGRIREPNPLVEKAKTFLLKAEPKPKLTAAVAIAELAKRRRCTCLHADAAAD